MSSLVKVAAISQDLKSLMRSQESWEDLPRWARELIDNTMQAVAVIAVGDSCNDPEAWQELQQPAIRGQSIAELRVRVATESARRILDRQEQAYERVLQQVGTQAPRPAAGSTDSRRISPSVFGDILSEPICGADSAAQAEAQRSSKST